MRQKVVAPYGAWSSPVTPDLAAATAFSQFRFFEPHVDTDGAFWIEARPDEDGREVLVWMDEGDRTTTLTPSGFNVRSRANGYGGGAWLKRGDTIFFSNHDDQRLYRQELDGRQPRPVTAEPPQPAAWRYADGRATPDGRWIVCVRETHDAASVTNALVGVDPSGQRDQVVLASGRDFYSTPRVSRDGRTLAWLSWDHPRMPWDGTELYVADLGDGEIGEARLAAGGPSESVFQPEWDREDVLHFVSDRTGWWNLYRFADGVEPVRPIEAELGAPQWLFGLSTYALLDDGRIAARVNSHGAQRLGYVTTEGALVDGGLPYTSMTLPYLRTDGRRVIFVAATPTEPRSVVLLDTDTGEEQVLRRVGFDIDDSFASVAEAIEYPTQSGVTAHALYYPPKNPMFDGPEEERPPLIVSIHGGPTSQVDAVLDSSIQFFTTRGFAVVDVNYGGSTGYGRSYRERLKGQWGVVDRFDAVAAARHVVARGDADEARVAITGGSAGGYTTLLALALDDFFGAGSSWFGVVDLETFAADTHNFESRYLESLVGPYPEAEEVYRARSPVRFADRIRAPLLLLQGLDDDVVPPSQAEQMVAALRVNGVAFAYLGFEGEQHGFRRADTIRSAFEAELYFYGRIFGFEPADRLDPVEIENL